MNTAAEWEKWGSQDPYYGVLTEQRFRRSEIDADSKNVFFDSGDRHVEELSNRLQRHFGFQPRTVLDFGCGTGRLSLAFAKRYQSVTGVDVSKSMVEEAKRNQLNQSIENVNFRVCHSDFGDSDQSYDLVNSYIVIQHIRHRKGMRAIENLINSVKPSGALALHVTFGNRESSVQSTHWAELLQLLKIAKHRINFLNNDPQMVMTTYNLNKIMRLLLNQGFTESFCELTDHGGCYGINILSRRQSLTVDDIDLVT